MKSILSSAALIAIAAGATACNPQKFGLAGQSDQFAQSVKYDATVDILWVVDSSGSMGPRQAALANEMPSLMSALNAKGLQWRMAATTMDFGPTGERGAFLARDGGPAFVEPSTDGGLGMMTSRLQPGADGSPVERGLQGMKAALSAPNAQGPNAGFLRPNALLVVAFLSDEEDQSVAADYAGFLNLTRPPLSNGQRGWIADFIGVLPTDPLCKTSQWGDFNPGLKYLSLVQLSGGISESVCQPNLSRLSSDVQSRILEVVTAYKLSTSAQVASIRVLVDGAPVARDAANGWTYDDSTASIVFHGGAIPAPNASIKVDYDPQGAA